MYFQEDSTTARTAQTTISRSLHQEGHHLEDFLLLIFPC
jgi:hypothetical protein